MQEYVVVKVGNLTMSGVTHDELGLQGGDILEYDYNALRVSVTPFNHFVVHYITQFRSIPKDALVVVSEGHVVSTEAKLLLRNRNVLSVSFYDTETTVKTYHLTKEGYIKSETRTSTKCVL